MNEDLKTIKQRLSMRAEKREPEATENQYFENRTARRDEGKQKKVESWQDMYAREAESEADLIAQRPGAGEQVATGLFGLAGGLLGLAFWLAIVTFIVWLALKILGET